MSRQNKMGRRAVVAAKFTEARKERRAEAERRRKQEEEARKASQEVAA